MSTIKTEPLTATSFEPFGQVIEHIAAGDGNTVIANQGTLRLDTHFDIIYTYLDFSL